MTGSPRPGSTPISTDGSEALTKTALSDPSDDWRDAEISYLRGEVARLQAELDRVTGYGPMRRWEMRADWKDWR